MSQGVAVLVAANSSALIGSKACCQLQAAPCSLACQRKTVPLVVCHRAIASTAQWLQEQQPCSKVWQSLAYGMETLAILKLTCAACSGTHTSEPTW